MFPKVPLYLASALSFATYASSQSPPANLLADIWVHSTNQCCGGSIGWYEVPAGRCLQLNTIRDGFSVEIEGIWGGTATNPVGYGYVVLYKAPTLCREPGQLLRAPGCNRVSVPGGVYSLSWEKETYPLPGFGSNSFEDNQGALGQTERSFPLTKEPKSSEECLGPSSFKYTDPRIGFEREINLHGSLNLATTVQDLYKAKDWVSLEKY